MISLCYDVTMLKIIILIIHLISAPLLGNVLKEDKLPSYAASLSMLKSIDNDAIVLGTGEKVLYVFIDPLCKHSRKFVSMVSNKSVMLSKYQYHFFLFSLPRLKSQNVVTAIYMSDNPSETLLKIMVDNKHLSQKQNDMTDSKIKRISSTAEKIGVFKRPYIFIIK